jgi:putative tryptophan/tyrosine transport system substrate-binding protein
MRRREFIALLGGGATWPLAARAQQPERSITRPRVAFLGAESQSTNQHFFDAFHQGMTEHGYIDGQNVILEQRWAEGRSERFPELVGELIGVKSDVIVVVSLPAALAAKSATKTNPMCAGRPARSRG